MTLVEKARKMRAAMETAAVSLDDATASTAQELFPRLKGDGSLVKAGIRIIPDTITAGLAFAKGEQGWCGDVLYVSTIDANVWTPDAYPAGWEIVE